MIFESNTCEICHEQQAEKGRRCAHCSTRYDASGKPFIVYCTVMKYEALLRVNHDVTRPDLYFWVCDGRVGNAPASHVHLIGKQADEMNDELVASGYVLKSWSDPVYK